MKVDAQQPIFSRPVLVAIALAVLAIASIAVLIQRSAPDAVVVGTIRSIGTHRLCVAAGTDKARCVDADSPRSIEGFALGDCVQVKSSSNRTLIELRRVASCP